MSLQMLNAGYSLEIDFNLDSEHVHRELQRMLADDLKVTEVHTSKALMYPVSIPLDSLRGTASFAST